MNKSHEIDLSLADRVNLLNQELIEHFNGYPSPEVLALVAAEIFKQKAAHELKYIQSFIEKNPETAEKEINAREVEILAPHRQLAAFYQGKADTLSALFSGFPQEEKRAGASFVTRSEVQGKR